MKANVIVFGILTALFAAIIISGCIAPELNGEVKFKEMQRFESYNAMVDAFKEAQGKSRSFGVLEIVSTPMMATSVGAEDASVGVDYSRTNIQVEGVDEADIVKSDGKFIYNFSKGRLVITDAFPIETASIVSKTELKELQPLEMFVSESKLLLFANKFVEQVNYDGRIGIAEERIAYPYYASSKVAVQVYDVSDRANPVLEKELEFEGSYLTSRLIGENAFFVVNTWPHYWILEKNVNESSGESIIPLMKENGVEKEIAIATEIAFLPPMPAESFVTIASIKLNSGVLEKEVVAGSAESVFASLDNVYLASTVWMVSETPVVKEVERVIVGDSEKTVVNKFNLSDGKINFVGQGSVKGHVLNQFSMDEFAGNFRIATTLGEVSGQSSNNLYVLDEEMKTVGVLEGLAPGESIYSARFMGDKAYLVTFKKVDPLFVIDLSNAASPKVLGKLKIPGYSDYLHPIDETHLIGVGKEAIESGFGDFAWYQGLKMAVFDVSNVEKPIELHKIVIGDRGTDSFALHDHKAFLYDKEKELLVLPIMLAVIPEEQKSKPLREGVEFPAYGEPVFQGAFVFKLTLENGFEEKGRITHASAEDELKRGYYFGDDYSVKRALYIENVLYTLSERMLKANGLSDLRDLKEFVFE